MFPSNDEDGFELEYEDEDAGVRKFIESFLSFNSSAEEMGHIAFLLWLVQSGYCRNGEYTLT